MNTNINHVYKVVLLTLSMSDGIGDAVGGLLGVAILAGVASNVMGGRRRTTTVTRTVYRNRPKRKAKPAVTVVKRTTRRPRGLFDLY